MLHSSHPHDPASALDPAHNHHHPDADVAQLNRQHFDKDAATYDDQPDRVEFARRLGKYIVKTYPFDEDATTVLDFACGTGLLSRELAPHTKTIVGIDISQAMVDQYNMRVHNQGIPPSEMQAIRAELKGETGELDGQKFDIVVCSMAFHHFASPADEAQRLAFFLKPGGILMIADIAKTATEEEVIPSQYHHVVPHAHGFSEGEIKVIVEHAGLTKFSFAPVTTAKAHDKTFSIFLAQGVKP